MTERPSTGQSRPSVSTQAVAASERLNGEDAALILQLWYNKINVLCIVIADNWQLNFLLFKHYFHTSFYFKLLFES